MITVVSGLPRSGNPLVMQMLAAGGHAILSDDLRPADDDNPRGYLEFAAVKSLERDSSWLAEADKKAVKIISFLLTKLPADFSYRIIFLRRNLSEVLRSQEKMLQRRGQPPGPPDNLMAAHFTKHLQTVDDWLNKQDHIQWLDCSYTDVIQSPEKAAQSIQQFLGMELDIKKMTTAVAPDLYRNKRQ